MSNDNLTPSECIYAALEDKTKAVRMTVPRGRQVDFTVAITGKTDLNAIWVRQWHDQDVRSTAETHKVMDTARRCAPDVELIEESESVFHVGDGDE